jgi:phosphoserine aminotransferase
MSKRVINFNPGPSALPLEALEEAQRELLDYQGTGMSIMEHSHRGKDFEAVHNEAITLIRELLAVPADYDVLFLQGGASTQFAMVPMNFLKAGASADYIVTGTWSEKAIAEAKILGNVRVAASTAENGVYRRVPKQAELDLDPNAAYVHYTTNNTIFGSQFHYIPQTVAPLIADMSSDIMSAPIDVSKFGLIYAGAQKNAGPSGVTIVIARKSLIADGRTDIPKIFRYSSHASQNSMYNTCPTFSIYMVRNVMKVLKQRGGLTAVQKTNEAKAKLLYGCIDERSNFYQCPVEKESRSWMNPVFRLPTEELEQTFLAEAKTRGMVGLKGHRSVGGIRVSMYNAIGLSDIETLVSFMTEFASR